MGRHNRLQFGGSSVQENFARRKRTWGGLILGRGQGGLSLSSGLGTRAERGMAVGIYVSMQGSQFSDKTEGNNV